MENTINPNIPTNQTEPELSPILNTESKFNPRLLIILASVVIVVSVYIGIQIGKKQIPQNNLISIIPTSTPIPTSTIVPTITPTIVSTIIPTRVPSPVMTIIPTVTPKTFEQEEKLLRKTLAGFEGYIGNGNTTGALTFFTPALTASAKQKYEAIRTKNLQFTLKSWSFVVSDNYLVETEEIKDGYRVRINECRSNNINCPILYVELVRNEKAENGFLISRYYDQSFAYQNNLGEEIKYQGFGL